MLVSTMWRRGVALEWACISRCALHHELATNMNRSCKRASDLVQPSLLTLRYPRTNHAMERAMIEFFRSGLIILMGMTVMAAGVLVVFYG